MCNTGSQFSGSGSGSGIEFSSSGSGSRFGSSSGSGDESSGFGSGFPGDTFVLFLLRPDSDQICINVTVIGDMVIENMENIQISFSTLDPRVSFSGGSEARIYIIDDDGESNIT